MTQDFDIDCLIVGNNQMNFSEYVRTLRQMGEKAGAFRDVGLSFYEANGEILSCTDHFNRHYRSDGAEFSYDNVLSATVTVMGSFLDQAGFSFDFINSFQEGREKLVSLLKEKRIRAVAITTTYYVFALPIMEIMDLIRTHAPQVKVIVGGPYINTQFKINGQEEFAFLMSQIGADYYVVNSQGEQALVDVLSALRDNKEPTDVPNCIAAAAAPTPGFRQTAEVHQLADHMTTWSLFRDAVGEDNRRMVMTRTAVSCPFSCSFCSFPAHAGTYRYLPPDLVIKELDHIEALGSVNSVTFIDDTFNVPIHRFEDILERLLRRNYSFRWNCNLRLQHVNENIISKLRQAGCEGVFLGLESGSDTILRNMNKKSRARSYLQGLKWLRQHEIMSYASFIIGFPGETDETVGETIAMIEEGQPDFFRAQLWYYDTMTPVHDSAEKYGLRNSQFEWTHNTMTSRQAADWIEHIHGNITKSVWLPQNDFDYPSLFNLLSRGWSIEQIKAFLRDFNSRVRRRLGNEGQAPPIALVQNDAVANVTFAF
ncbi:radical SAM protein [Phaeobacter sp. B1627]|uniref:radical SAM protein n=1 Tax=Phaeobacter sp. B1627 TaxID=2583809 RepID=UPI00111B0A58|nr:radical SAM protein [Phaeobacter sp. B1627]TNJ42305.1 radical SAM protein [Phaeobacter sp. B1627]